MVGAVAGVLRARKVVGHEVHCEDRREEVRMGGIVGARVVGVRPHDEQRPVAVDAERADGRRRGRRGRRVLVAARANALVSGAGHLVAVERRGAILVVVVAHTVAVMVRRVHGFLPHHGRPEAGARDTERGGEVAHALVRARRVRIDHARAVLRVAGVVAALRHS